MDSVAAHIRSLSASAATVRETAAAELVRTGGAAVPELLRVARHGDLVPRMHALAALGKIGTSEAIPLIHQALRGTRDIEAENAAWAAAEMRDRSAIPHLHWLISYGRPPLPTVAANAIGKIGGEGAFDYLCSIPRGDDLDVLSGAARGPGELGDPRAVPVLLDWSRCHVGEKVACAALQRIGLPGVPRLIEALTHSEDVAVTVLASFGPVIEPALREALDAPHQRVWSRAAALLGGLHLATREDAEDLIVALDDPFDTPRVHAAEGLRFLAETQPDPELSQAVAPLRRLAAPWALRSAGLRTACRRALRQIEVSVGPLLTLPLESAAPPAAPKVLPLPAESSEPPGPLPLPAMDAAE